MMVDFEGQCLQQDSLAGKEPILRPGPECLKPGP